MPKYIVKEHSILYKEVEADSREEAEEIALGEPVHVAESYIEVEEGELLPIHYLVIGHGEFKDQEWRHMMFDDEQMNI